MNRRKFITAVGCMLAAIIFIIGCIVAICGDKVYDNTLAGRPEYEHHMTYLEFYESLNWGDLEHTSEDTMHAYEQYLHENLTKEAKEAEEAKEPYRKGTICCFIFAGMIIVGVLIVNVADEAAKYNRNARHGVCRQMRRD